MHPTMVFSRKDVALRTLTPGAFTPVIATCQADIRLLASALFSLLLRTTADRLAHVMVLINGPDDRTGDPGPQDRKQAFLEDLRRCKTPGGKDMPLTVIRVWSRVGHSELCDMAVPWVTSLYYVLMHDDVLILDPQWPAHALNQLSSPPVALVSARPALLCPAGRPVSALPHGNGRILRLPHLNTCFLVVDKARLAGLRTEWTGRHTPVSPPAIAEHLVNVPEWVEYYSRHGGVDSDVSQSPEQPVHAVSHDVGAWVYQDMCANGYEVALLPDNTINHVGAASWDAAVSSRMGAHHAHYAKLESELRAHPALWSVYSRHCTPIT